MYMAKRDSKGSYRVVRARDARRAVERLELQAELAAGARAETSSSSTTSRSFDLNDGDRLRRRGAAPLAPPDARDRSRRRSFIPLAEETGLIIPIGRWVLDEACRQAAALHEQFRGPPLTMSVNLSVKQLQSETIVDDVGAALDDERTRTVHAHARDHRDRDDGRHGSRDPAARATSRRSACASRWTTSAPATRR